MIYFYRPVEMVEERKTMQERAIEDGEEEKEKEIGEEWEQSLCSVKSNRKEKNKREGGEDEMRRNTNPLNQSKFNGHLN